jgi:ParB family chromosome partitioning protein
MAQQKRGLGKGLGALIPTAPLGSSTAAPGGPGGRGAGEMAAGQGGPGWAEQSAVGGAYFEELTIGSVTPNPRQPRQAFDEEALDELAASIREVGLLQPVVVRKVMPGRYELIMGERRWRACQRAELEQIPAIVRATADDDLLRDALMENLHREQLNPL